MNSDGKSQAPVIHDGIQLIKDICIKNVPFWDNLNHDDLEMEGNSMGFNNDVYLVKLKHINKNDFPVNTLIVKQRTQFTDLMFNTELQHSVAKLLGDNGLGPRVIGRFSDYTIQEYVRGKVIETASYKNLSVITGIASSLAKFHKKGTEISPADLDRTPFILRQINKWSQHAERIIMKNNLDFDFNELQSSFEMYKTLLENHIKTSNSFDRTSFPPNLSLCPYDHSIVEYANLKSTLDKLADEKLINS
ncbi:choline kinase [Theileria orientalis]|uniref:Choline kinase n=1 Tax=Theileria orientalis TaxID=68886 RepID=A0A976QTS7_THEOR|nr:choline kinase [Theileria orientalis]